MSYADWVGATGVGLLLLAYFLHLFKWISAEGHFYYGLNFLGASLSCYASFLIGFIPFVILEGTWALVSLVAYGKWIIKKRAFSKEDY